MTSPPPPAPQAPLGPNDPGAPSDARARWVGVAFAVVLTIAVRSLVALSRLDELELERYSANLGWALLNGVPLDPAQLPIIPHLRGSFVFGVLCVPFLWLLGPQLLAMKALAIGSSAVGAGLLSGVAGRAFGARGAFLAGALFALGPPSFQMVDVLALGSHADTIPYLCLALWLIAGPGVDPARGTRTATFVALGTAFGAGLFFSMQVWVAGPALLAAWWIRDRSFWRRRGVLFAAAAAAPWIALVPVVTRSATLVNKPLTARLLDGGPLDVPLKFARGLFARLPASWNFEPLGVGWAGWVLGSVLIVAAVSAALCLPWRRLRRGSGGSPAEAVGIYCLLHSATLLAAYAVSDFELNLSAWEDGMGSRYFMPLIPAFVLLSVHLIERLRGRLPAAAGALAAALLASGAAGVLPLLEPTVGLRQPRAIATEFYSFAGHLPRAAGPDLEARLALVDRLEPDWGEFRALAHRETFADEGNLSRSALVAALARARELPARVRPFRFAALGAVTAERAYDLIASGTLGGLAQEEHEAVLIERLVPIASEALTRLDGDAQRWFLRGFGRQLTSVQNAGILPALNDRGGSADLGARIGFRLLQALPPAARVPAVEGMGFQLGLRLTRYERAPRPILAALDELPAEARRRWLRSAGWGFRMRFFERDFDPRAPLSIETQLAPEDWPAFAEGLAWPGAGPDAPRVPAAPPVNEAEGR